MSRNSRPGKPHRPRAQDDYPSDVEYDAESAPPPSSRKPLLSSDKNRGRSSRGKKSRVVNNSDDGDYEYDLDSALLEDASPKRREVHGLNGLLRRSIFLQLSMPSFSP